MIVNELIPIPVNKLEFSYEKRKFIPQKYGCYVLTNFNNEILYIGLSDNLFQRVQKHLDSHEKNDLTKYGRAYWYYYMELDNEKQIYSTERGWLNLYELKHGELPPLNKNHSPII